MTTTPTPEQLAKWKYLGIQALTDAATACEALLAERDELRKDLHHIRVDDGKHFTTIMAERDQALARLAACEIVEANYQEALGEAKKLKAQLDVAVDALHDVCDSHAGERSCRFTYSEPDNGPCDCHVDLARAALAKIKET